MKNLLLWIIDPLRFHQMQTLNKKINEQKTECENLIKRFKNLLNRTQDISSIIEITERIEILKNTSLIASSVLEYKNHSAGFGCSNGLTNP